MKTNKIFALTESAVMIALAVILSFIKVIDMPFGGSVTACAMLPIIIIAFRRKTMWGLLTAFVYSLLQLVLGLNSLQYATSGAAACAIIFLDYIFAFMSLGLGGIFRDKLGNQQTELVLGALVSCMLRYVFHIISGCTVWAGLSIPNADAFIYSVVYNAAYMIPEIVITLAGAWYLSRIINFKSDNLKLSSEHSKGKMGLCTGIGVLVLTVDVVAAFLYIFQKMQTKDGFDVTALTNANPIVLSVLAAVLIVFAVLTYIFATKEKRKA